MTGCCRKWFKLPPAPKTVKAGQEVMDRDRDACYRRLRQGEVRRGEQQQRRRRKRRRRRATISSNQGTRRSLLNVVGQRNGGSNYFMMVSRIKQTRCLKIIESLLLIACTLALILLAANCRVASALIQVPNRHTVASIPGDLVIGILVPVHERPSPKQAQTRTCGAVREQYGIQRVEAAFRTIDSINADPTILPNITLGIEIRDSCWHSPIALEQSIEFIRDAMAASEQSQGKLQIQAAAGAGNLVGGGGGGATATSSTLPELASNNSTTNSICAPLLLRQQQLQQQQLQSKKVKNIVGVVGPASSTDTVQVQNLLQLFNMPQVGYSATSRDLSNKNFFKYFLRVVPSDKLQAQVMIDLMLAHNWTYITVAYTEGSYGSSLMNAFRERAQEVGICFATLESMPPNADDAKFDELIEAIQKHPNARVVICMCEGRTVGKLFGGFKRKNITNEYLVVGSDGWSDRFDVVEKQEEYALGGISIRIHSAYVNDFDDYYFGLNPFINHRNPWFAEFWETRFQCNLELGSQSSTSASSSSSSAITTNRTSSSQQSTSGQQQQRPFVRPPGAKVYNRTCTGRESLRNNHKQDAKMAFVQKSIITMALGLDSMQRAICPPNKPGLCPEMLPVNGSTLLQHLMNVSFSFLDEEVYFDEQGDPPGKYEILNFQRRRPIHSGTGADGQYGSEAESTAGGGIDFAARPRPPASKEDDLSGSSAGTPLFGSDYSIATVAGNISESTLAEKRRLNPLYDSYSTLKVYRPRSSGATPTNQDGQQQQQMQFAQHQQLQRSSRSIRSGGRLRRLTTAVAATRQQQLSLSSVETSVERPQYPPASGYSSTSGYEYVHVGSWKSSDGLSLFGDIHWPSQSSSELSSSGSTYSLGHDNWQLGPANMPEQVGGPPGRQHQTGGFSHMNTLPKSVCSLPCAKGHAKKIQSDSVKCCWVCVPCRAHEYLFNEFKCKACEKGWWPNSMQTGCDQIPIQYLDWRSMEALMAISIAVFGLVLTLATAIVFIRHNNTPVVKSTTRELSYMILFAMFLCYINTFFLVAKPRKETCFVTRILPGFAFAMMYGALVTKTNRIARILAGSKKKIITRRPRFMSATSQVAITWIIVLIECVIIVFMLIREPADKMHDYPSDDRVVLVCNTTTMGIIVPLGLDFFLIAMCTLYAFKTRNVPENFNEAKFIGFTMYTTLVIWVAFVAIYLSSDHKVTTLCLCISFSALFALFLLFFPRCYIIIFKPEKNNRSYFTTIKNVRCHIGYQIGSAGAAAAAAAAQQSSASGQLPNYQQPAHNNNNSSNTTSTTNNNQPSGVGGGTGTTSNSLDYDQSYEPPPSAFQSLPQQGQTPSRQGSRGRTSGALQRREREQPREVANRHWLVRRGDSVVCPIGGGDGGHNNNEATKRRDSQTPQWHSLDQAAESAVTLVDGHQANQKQHGQSTASQEGPLFSSMLNGFLSVFSRHSRKKECDKATSIQQHLRAIRHAENLDRQTHFRRSQVQRLMQRFDSTAGNAAQPENPNNWSSRSSHSATANFFAANSSQSNNIMTATTHLGRHLELAAEREDGERLLMVLRQLIGVHNVWRLADVLHRHCSQQQAHAESSTATTNSLVVGHRKSGANTTTTTTRELILAVEQEQQQQPKQLQQPTLHLDLDKLANRKLALTLLRFLAEVVRNSIEEIRQRGCSLSSPVSLEIDSARAEAESSTGKEVDLCATLGQANTTTTTAKINQNDINNNNKRWPVNSNSMGHDENTDVVCKSSQQQQQQLVNNYKLMNTTTSQSAVAQQSDEISPTPQIASETSATTVLSYQHHHHHHHHQQQRQTDRRRVVVSNGCKTTANNDNSDNLSSRNQVAKLEVARTQEDIIKPPKTANTTTTLTTTTLTSGGSAYNTTAVNDGHCRRVIDSQQSAASCRIPTNDNVQGRARKHHVNRSGGHKPTTLLNSNNTGGGDDDEQEEDPIRRALECIMGTATLEAVVVSGEKVAHKVDHHHAAADLAQYTFINENTTHSKAHSHRSHHRGHHHSAASGFKAHVCCPTNKDYCDLLTGAQIGANRNGGGSLLEVDAVRPETAPAAAACGGSGCSAQHCSARPLQASGAGSKFCGASTSNTADSSLDASVVIMTAADSDMNYADGQAAKEIGEKQKQLEEMTPNSIETKHDQVIAFTPPGQPISGGQSVVATSAMTTTTSTASPDPMGQPTNCDCSPAALEVERAFANETTTTTHTLPIMSGGRLVSNSSAVSGSHEGGGAMTGAMHQAAVRQPITSQKEVTPSTSCLQRQQLGHPPPPQQHQHQHHHKHRCCSRTNKPRGSHSPASAMQKKSAGTQSGDETVCRVDGRSLADGHQVACCCCKRPDCCLAPQSQTLVGHHHRHHQSSGGCRRRTRSGSRLDNRSRQTGTKSTCLGSNDHLSSFSATTTPRTSSLSKSCGDNLASKQQSPPKELENFELVDGKL